MSIFLGSENISEYQNFRTLPFVFTDEPSPKLLEKFAHALNRNGHLPYRINLEQLLQLTYVQIAHTHDGEFIAGCAIKHCDGELAEIGFMLVDKNYRRLGLAEYMTKTRINIAQKKGANILYTKVREDNVKSMNNLRKAGFQTAGSFFSQKDSFSPVTWLYLPLKPMSHQECSQRLKRKLINSVSFI